MNSQTPFSQTLFPLESTDSFNPLLDKIGNSRIVLLGSASYGTREFYEWRAKLTERLIKEKGFSFIAAEGDWNSCYEVNRFLKGKRHQGRSVQGVLRNFKYWPTWVWANEEMEGFVTRLLEYNQALPEEKKIGFYGLGIYGLHESVNLISTYADKNPDLMLSNVYEAYRCFEPFGNDPHTYAFLTPFVPEDKQEEVAKMLAAYRSKVREYENDKEDFFCAKQDALASLNAEEYYRVMLKGNREAWNQREVSMAEMVEELLALHGPESKVIIWANNTHVADARGADTSRHNILNMGQLLKEKFNEDVFIVGAGLYAGEVLAAQVLGAPVSKMEVPPPLENSWEDLLHRMEPKDKIVIFDQNPMWEEARFQRDIGLMYMQGRDYLNYVPVKLSKSYDALIFVDQSTALRPLTNIEPEYEDLEDSTLATEPL